MNKSEREGQAPGSRRTPWVRQDAGRGLPLRAGVTLPRGDVVFLIDISRSMRDDYQGKPLIEVVKTKVIERISGFEPSRQFNVVFFADGGRAYRPKMVPATRAEVGRAARFIRKTRVGGNTNLEAGLRRPSRIRG